MKETIKRIPVIGPAARRLKRELVAAPVIGPLVRDLLSRFSGSQDYWEHRYADGGDSGSGSYGRLAEFKSQVLNAFVREQKIDSVIEFGCGDGNQLGLATYPRYVGVDVSTTALARCRAAYRDDASKRFVLLADSDGEKADLAMSLDVIYHLVEESVFVAHLEALFAAATRFVIIYSTNEDRASTPEAPHVRHRAFLPWVEAHAEGWQLRQHIPNRFPFDGNGDTTSRADFFIFERG